MDNSFDFKYGKILELEIMEKCNELEDISNLMELNFYNNDIIYIRNNSYFMEMSLEEFKQRAINIIQKIMLELDSFFSKMRIHLAIQVQKFQLNKKLDDLKKIFIMKREKSLNTTFDYFDTKKYMDYYKSFINQYTKELKLGLNKEFKSAQEYNEWRELMIHKIENFNSKISKEEIWKLTKSINESIQLTEREAKNRENNLKMIQESSDKSFKELKDYYKDIKEFDNGLKNCKYNNGGLISTICRQLSKAVRTVTGFVFKHPFLCITALLMILLA